ncbi:unnamed protein product [Moneuplotes crassus]|uniref:Uncharacterized protein n=1 Tax=Euplotes crassus TaxID=5936 RepID=A0AAD1XUM7_EUPCR|nr:unnamed protein product [Moneuplotes crassus]
MSFNYQSEVSAEDLLDEYIEKEDRSYLEIMTEVDINDSHSARVPSRNTMEHDFNFLGSRMNEYNNNLLHKLNYETDAAKYPKQAILKPKGYDFMHIGARYGQFLPFSSPEQETKSSCPSFSEFYKQSVLKNDHAYDSIKTENLIKNSFINQKVNTEKGYDINDFLPDKKKSGLVLQDRERNKIESPSLRDHCSSCCSCKHVSETRSNHMRASFSSSGSSNRGNNTRRQNRPDSSLFEYKLPEREDDFDTDNTMDLCRDTETENEAFSSKNGPEFSKYISEVNLQMLGDQRPPRPVKENEKTLKPAHSNQNIMQSPAFQGSLERVLNNDNSVSSLNSGRGRNRRSRSKITRVHSIKKFKEDELNENMNPNSSFMPHQVQDQNSYESTAKKHQSEARYNVSGTKIEFKTLDSCYTPAVQNTNESHMTNNELDHALDKEYAILEKNYGQPPLNSSMISQDHEKRRQKCLQDTSPGYKMPSFMQEKALEQEESLQYDVKLPSNQPLLDRIEELEQKRLGIPNDKPFSYNSHQELPLQEAPDESYQNCDAQEIQESQKTLKPLEMASEYLSYEDRKKKALEELDEIIASSEDEILAVNNYLNSSKFYQVEQPPQKEISKFEESHRNGMRKSSGNIKIYQSFETQSYEEDTYSPNSSNFMSKVLIIQKSIRRYLQSKRGSVQKQQEFNTAPTKQVDKNLYIFPENLNDSKNQTLSSVDIPEEAVQLSKSIENDISSINCSAHYVTSIQNIQDIKRRVLTESAEKSPIQYKYSKENSMRSTDKSQKIEKSMQITDKQIEEAKLQVQRELAKLEETSSDESYLFSDREAVEEPASFSAKKEEHKITITHREHSQDDEFITLENGNILTPSQNKNSEAKTSREATLDKRNDTSESFLNYSLSDEEMEHKLKQSIANLITAVTKKDQKDTIQTLNELDLSKSSQIEGMIKENLKANLLDRDENLSSYLSSSNLNNENVKNPK